MNCSDIEYLNVNGTDRMVVYLDEDDTGLLDVNMADMIDILYPLAIFYGILFCTWSRKVCYADDNCELQICHPELYTSNSYYYRDIKNDIKKTTKLLHKYIPDSIAKIIIEYSYDQSNTNKDAKYAEFLKETKSVRQCRCERCHCRCCCSINFSKSYYNDGNTLLVTLATFICASTFFVLSYLGFYVMIQHGIDSFKNWSDVECHLYYYEFYYDRSSDSADEWIVRNCMFEVDKDTVISQLCMDNTYVNNSIFLIEHSGNTCDLDQGKVAYDNAVCRIHNNNDTAVYTTSLRIYNREQMCCDTDYCNGCCNKGCCTIPNRDEVCDKCGDCNGCAYVSCSFFVLVTLCCWCLTTYWCLQADMFD